jgi:hypothetical protein
MIPGKEDLWFLPLGGCGEIGMNMNLYGHDGAWLMNPDPTCRCRIRISSPNGVTSWPPC